MVKCRLCFKHEADTVVCNRCTNKIVLADYYLMGNAGYEDLMDLKFNQIIEETRELRKEFELLRFKGYRITRRKRK